MIITQENTFERCYSDLYAFGKKVSPRGLEVLEIENYYYVLQPFDRFANFEGRNLSIDYIKAEFLWYLKGDKFDTSICKYATMWSKLINSDGSINSNYGQYFFGEQQQFERVLNELKSDSDSRRASVIILSAEHLASSTFDYPCTYSVNFRIRNNKLNMSVKMRSQDAVFGMGNDAPCFSFIHEMMFNALKEQYPSLQYGEYHHSVDSYHIYERHFKLLGSIVGTELEKAKRLKVECPTISGPDEVKFLRAYDFSNIPENFEFTKWLTSFSDPKYAELESELKKGPVQQQLPFNTTN